MGRRPVKGKPMTPAERAERARAKKRERVEAAVAAAEMIRGTSRCPAVVDAAADIVRLLAPKRKEGRHGD